MIVRASAADGRFRYAWRVCLCILCAVGKAAAQADYASRYCEAEDFLTGMLGGFEDEVGPLTRHNEQVGSCAE